MRTELFEHKKVLDNACRQIIRQRLAEQKEERESRERDMLDVFLALKDHASEALASLTCEFALAGSHTTSQMITWSIY